MPRLKQSKYSVCNGVVLYTVFMRVMENLESLNLEFYNIILQKCGSWKVNWKSKYSVYLSENKKAQDQGIKVPL